MKFLKSISHRHWPILIVLPVFLLLFARNPFSIRTLIPNFEPFPDGFHYVTPARCMLAGFGRNLCREGRVLTPSVPPLYSWYLLPFFSINNDPRMFYFGNVALSLSFVLIFYLLLKHLVANKTLQALALFLLVTNYYFYWFPSLAMAENLLIPLFLACLYLLLRPVSYLRAIIFMVLASSLFGAKYSAAPITLTYFVLYSAKMFQNRKSLPNFWKFALLLVAVGTTAFFLSGGSAILYQAASLLQRVVFQERLGLHTTSESASAWISTVFVAKNFPLYLQALTGGNIYTLWVNGSLVPKIIAVVGMTSLVIGSFYGSFRTFCRSVLILFFVQIAFLSLFYSFESRYILYCIPIVLLAFVLFLQEGIKYFQHKVPKSFTKRIIPATALVVFLLYSIASGLRIKNQIMLNLRHAETPWWYLSVLDLNKYFATVEISNPVVITAINPFLVDYYATRKYELLPLANQQDFNTDENDKSAVWGPNDYTNLLLLYQQKLLEGKEVYVAKYGLGHESDKIQAFQSIQDTFDLELVQSGCYDLCNLYQLHLQN